MGKMLAYCDQILVEILTEFRLAKFQRGEINHDNQTRNQSSQTKPYVSRLGSCQCCTLKIEISDCNEFGFFGQLLDIYRKIFLPSLIPFQNKP